jgi:predicted RNA polymerase sigma factor
VQAAIAAIHDEAPSAEATDWRQVATLYEFLVAQTPNPMVALNRAVAIAMADGPRAGLEVLASIEEDNRMAGHHRLHAVKAHLLEMAGDTEAARESYRAAARATTSQPERRYLEARASRLPAGVR